MEKKTKTTKRTTKTSKTERGAQKATKPRTTKAKTTTKTPATKTETKPKAETKQKTPAKKAETLEAKVEKLKEEAKRKGLLDNLLFEELIDEFTYQTQLLKRLRKEIDDGDLMTAKTYVKSAPNMSPNKLIATYNATSNARVNTVSALAKLVKSFGEDADSSTDPLLKIMSGNN